MKKSPFRRSIAWYYCLVDILLLIWRHWVRVITLFFFLKRRICGKNLVVLIIEFQDKLFGAHLKNLWGIISASFIQAIMALLDWTYKFRYSFFSLLVAKIVSVTVVVFV